MIFWWNVLWSLWQTLQTNEVDRVTLIKFIRWGINNKVEGFAFTRTMKTKYTIRLR